LLLFRNVSGHTEQEAREGDMDEVRSALKHDRNQVPFFMNRDFGRKILFCHVAMLDGVQKWEAAVALR
jgi:hypothetical protein